MANTIDLGLVTAYGNAKEGGYTGTESQFNTLLANLPTYASNAAASATAAAGSASDAEDAADRAEAIVGGQFISYGQAQGLSDAQKMQARANISAGASNRNLLDNPFFTVNQRSFTSSTETNGVYTVDRWKINNGGGTGGTVSVTSQGYIQLTTGSTYISFQQMFGANELAGKTVTISINESGNIASYSFTVPARTASTQTGGTFVFKAGCRCNFFVMPTTSEYGYNFQLSIGQDYSATIRAVKLELGSYSTLANDVPPDYKTELDKCKWYFRRIKSELSYDPVGYGIQNSSTRAYIKIPGQMRVAPSASFVGILRLVGNASASVDVTSLSTGGTDAEGIVVLANTSGNLTANHACTMYLGSTSSYIDLSADL